jgi:Cu/Ag efflux protein CusF
MTRREMNHVSSLAIGWAAMIAASGYAVAGPVPRIVHTLHGMVVAVDVEACRLTVQARRLEVWMGAITSIYAVDNPKLMREVKAGDQIMGKVYEGETALHHVEIVAVAAPSASD